MVRLKSHLVGGGLAIDVDADDIDAVIDISHIQAIAARCLDGAAVHVNQFHTLHPGVGTDDDVVATDIYLHVGQASLINS